jgi:hypothetical protein
MVARARQPQRPRHVPILDEDWEWLEKAYGATSESKLGPGPAIRYIVHQFVKAQKAKEQVLVDAARAKTEKESAI